MDRRGDVYWAPLDGLRAVAVGAVVAFHLGLGWAPAGFLGVDLFFVISGYLITSLLLAEHDRGGGIAVRRFWSRRLRRLVPAAVAMIAATGVATRLWLVEAAWEPVRRDALASLTWVANWRYIADGSSYFEQSLGPSPLEHTWSLAVEEQFYLVWPLVMIVVLRWWRHRRLVVLAAFGGAAAASAVWMWHLHSPLAPDRAYQGTDARAQQLLVGAALAWVVANWPTSRFVAALRARPIARGATVTFGAVVVLADPGSGWLFGGGFLAISLLAAVLVVSCAVPGGGAMGWLGAPALVAVGRRSYGLYLWHWPVIVFVGAPMGIELPRWQLIALQLALVAMLTELSHRFVERPARRALRPRRAVGAWAVACAVCAVAISTVLPPAAERVLAAREEIRPAVLAEGAATPAPPPVPTPPTNLPADGDALRPPAEPLGSQPVPAGTRSPVPEQRPGAAASPPEQRQVLLVGDSTAVALAEAGWFMGPGPWTIDGQARLGCHVTSGTPIATAPPNPPPLPKECGRWRQDWSEAVQATAPDIVLVSVGPWEMLDHRVGDLELRFPTAAWEQHVRDGLSDMLDVVVAPGRTVVLLRLPCMFDASPTTRDRNDPARLAAYNAILESLAAARVGVVTAPLDEVLCPDPDPEGRATDTDLRFDGLHVTIEGGAMVWNWLFGEPWSAETGRP